MFQFSSFLKKKVTVNGISKAVKWKQKRSVFVQNEYNMSVHLPSVELWGMSQFCGLPNMIRVKHRHLVLLRIYRRDNQVSLSLYEHVCKQTKQKYIKIEIEANNRTFSFYYAFICSGAINSWLHFPSVQQIASHFLCTQFVVTPPTTWMTVEVVNKTFYIEEICYCGTELVMRFTAKMHVHFR